VAGGRNDGEVRVGELRHEVTAEHAGRLDLVVFSGYHEHRDVDLLGLARLVRHSDSLSSCVVAGERAGDVSSEWRLPR
jgi:hypothetical protein